MASVCACTGWLFLLLVSSALIANAASKVTLSPTSLSFGSHVVGTTSPAKNVTLTNGTGATLVINSIGATGDFAVQSKTCGASVAVGGKCTISVSFKPTATGTRSGALSIGDNGPNSPQTVSLSGTGVAVSLTSIAISPLTPTIPLGGTLQFTATGTYNDGSTQDLTSTANWASSSPGVATVSLTGLATSVSVGPTTISATFDSVSNSTTLTINPSATITAVPGQNAGVVNNYPVGNLAFAHAVTAGNQIIVAEKIEKYGGATAPSAPVKTSGTAVIGAFVQDAGTADTIYGNFHYSLRIWRAPVTSSGTLTLSFPASSAGYLLAAIDEFTGMASSPVDGSAVVKQGTGSAESTGNIVTHSSGMVLGITTEYSTSNFTYTINGTNIYQGGNGADTATGEAQFLSTTGAGTYDLTANNGVNNPFWLGLGVAYTAAPVGPPPTLVSISVTPVNPTITPGTNKQFAATGNYSDGTTQNLTGSVAWASATTSVATISGTGLATAANVGQSSISATSGPVVGSTTLTVSLPTLVSISVTPANPTIALGTSEQFVATGTYSDSSTQNLTSSATWGSSLTGVATISVSGSATAVNVGQTAISATFGSVNGSTTLTVATAVLVSIAVTPGAPTISQGISLPFTAMGTYSDGTNTNITATVAWSSDSTQAATINSSGLAIAVGTGSATIFAKENGITGSTSLGVTASTAVSGLPAGKFVYTVDASSNINGFAEASGGQLSLLAGFPSGTGQSAPSNMVVDPSGKFALVANPTSGNISVFSITAGSGTLVPVPGSPFTAGNNTYAIAVHPSGQFVYATNELSQSVSAYALNAQTGALTPVSGSPFSTNGVDPQGLALAPSGAYLYVATQDGNIQGYAVNTSTGVLTLIANSPFSLGASGQFPSIVADPVSPFLYVSSESGGEVIAFSMNTSTGALTPIAGSPFLVGANPSALAVARSGNFLYVANSGASSLAGYVINSANGSLLPMSSSPFSSGTTPNGLVVDPANQFLYAVNLGSQAISAYGLNASTGALSVVGGSPFGAATGATAIAATTGPATGQMPISAVPGQNAGIVNNYPVGNLTFAHAVTAGNQIIVAEKIEKYSGGTAPSTPVKVSGTAVIGAFVQDAGTADTIYGNFHYSLRIWRAPVTTSGTLTLSFPASSADYLLAAIDEFTGMASSPVDGTPVVKQGTGSAESTGNIVTHSSGMVLGITTEYSSSNFTYTINGTNIYQGGNGVDTATGEAQFLITTAAGTYDLTANNGVNNPFWLGLGVAYSGAPKQ